MEIILNNLEVFNIHLQINMFQELPILHSLKFDFNINYKNLR